MISRIEAMDQDTGLTTMRINYDSANIFAAFVDHNTTIDEDTSITIAQVLAYAAHINASLVWIDTDAGLRTTIHYGRYIVWLYR